MPVVIVQPAVGVCRAVATLQLPGGGPLQLTHTAMVVPLALTATWPTSGVSRENVVPRPQPCWATAGVARDHSDAQTRNRPDEALPRVTNESHGAPGASRHGDGERRARRAGAARVHSGHTEGVAAGPDGAGQRTPGRREHAGEAAAHEQPVGRQRRSVSGGAQVTRIVSPPFVATMRLGTPGTPVHAPGKVSVIGLEGGLAPLALVAMTRSV